MRIDERLPSRRVGVIVLTACLLGVGCGDDGGEPPDEPGAFGEACVDAADVEPAPCEAGLRCVAAGDGDDGTCAECGDESHCADGELCTAGRCVEAPPECEDEDDCAPRQLCVEGECVVDPRCLWDDECETGEACLEGACTPASLGTRLIRASSRRAEVVCECWDSLDLFFVNEAMCLDRFSPDADELACGAEAYDAVPAAASLASCFLGIYRDDIDCVIDGGCARADTCLAESTAAFSRCPSISADTADAIEAARDACLAE